MCVQPLSLTWGSWGQNGIFRLSGSISRRPVGGGCCLCVTVAWGRRGGSKAHSPLRFCGCLAKEGLVETFLSLVAAQEDLAGTKYCA